MVARELASSFYRHRYFEKDYPCLSKILLHILFYLPALVSYFQGSQIMLAVSGARKIQKADHPRLFNVVEEMTIAAGLPKIPHIYVIDDAAPNAFATGRDPRNCAVAVTSGLREQL